MNRLYRKEDVEVEVNFTCKSKQQQYLIEFILTFSCFKLKELADLLEVSTPKLIQVKTGGCYLSYSSTLKLVEIFCLLFDS